MINYITYGVSTLLTYFMGLASKKFGWNEELPIPVQNILIALFSLGISIVVMHIMNKPIDFEIIAQQVIASIGGSGTATLYYDTRKESK